MAQRQALQDLLLSIDGVAGVYFQPPETVKMEYPAIVYSRDYRVNEFADNGPYRSTKRYQIIVIDRDPDGKVAEAVAALPMSSFQRAYSADQLNHDVYSVYF